MLKVLYCILDNRFGGPHRRAHDIALRLREYDVETLFLTGRKTDDVWQPDDVTVFHLKHLQWFRRRRPLWNLIRFVCWLPHNVLRICRLIRSHGISIVHVDGVTNLVPALAARWTGTPLVWLYNDHLPGLLQRLLLPLVTALSTIVIVQGERLKEARTGARPRLHHKTTVLYSSVDPRRFDPERYPAEQKDRLRRDLGIPPECALVGMVGNLNRFKGHTYFLQAARRIKEQRKAVKFLIVGRRLDTDTDYWEHLQRLTAASGLQEDVKYTGFRSDVAALMAILDVFVLASVLESCPGVVLEAMAMRVPVVATDVGAVSELVLDGRTGLVVPPHDAEAIAQAVLAYLVMPKEQVRNVTDAARKRVESTFAVDIMAPQQYQVYERVSRRQPARPGAREA